MWIAKSVMHMHITIFWMIVLGIIGNRAVNCVAAGDFLHDRFSEGAVVFALRHFNEPRTAKSLRGLPGLRWTINVENGVVTACVPSKSIMVSRKVLLPFAPPPHNMNRHCSRVSPVRL